MNENKKIEDLVNAIGSMAEITAMFYKELLKNEVDARGASAMASTFLVQMMANGGGAKENNNADN